MDPHWIRGAKRRTARGAIAIVPLVAMVASGIYHLASPHSQVHNSLASGADDPRAASGINVVGERADDVVAQWNLGRMYAAGDGVKHDDLRAFEVFRGIADAHAEEIPGTPQARFVANAFVALGNYYLEGIPDTEVKPDIERARNVSPMRLPTSAIATPSTASAGCISTEMAGRRNRSKRPAGCRWPPAMDSTRPKRCSASCY